MRSALVVLVFLVATFPVLPGPAAAASEGPRGEGALIEPAREVQGVEGGLVVAAAPAAYARDTSHYMLGTVFPKVVFIESSASSPNTETWSSARKDAVIAEVNAGLAFWEANVPAGNPLDFATVVSADTSTVTVAYEPITMKGVTGSKTENQFAWLRPAMTALGTTPGPDTCPADPATDCGVLDAVRAYDHASRNAKGMDWAYTIFVVDSLADADGRFADTPTGWFAWAYLNGPYMVMTYDNAGWGIGGMNDVTAHETGHIFGATDEYAGPPTGERSGYFHELESDLSGKIMDSGATSAGISPGTKLQIGWRDTTPANARMDPRDTFPDGLALVPPPSPTNDNTASYAGTVKDVPVAAHASFLAKGFQSVSINKVTSVKWKVGAGAATSVATAPADAFAAGFAFTTTAIADGTRVVSVAAVNEVGNEDATPLTHTIVVDTVAPTLAILSPVAGNAYVGPVGVPLAVATPNPWLVGPLVHASASAGAGAGTAVAKVEFYRDGVLYATDTVAPYEGLGAVTALGGTHTLLAKAYDVAGNEASATRAYDAKP